MEIYKHKVSGKYFIFVEEVEGDIDKALFVNPLGRVILLNLDLFYDDIKDGEDDVFFGRDFITKEQIEAYQRYTKDWSDEQLADKAYY